MPRTNTKSSRSKKSSKPMRAQSTRVANEVATSAESAADPADAVLDSTTTETTKGEATRRVRPYQQRKNAPTARVTTAASISITKAQEYAFIREDLRRLLLTAGALTVVMIGLLFIIDR